MAGPTPITSTTPRVQDFQSTPTLRTTPPALRVNVDNSLLTGSRTPGSNNSNDFAFQGGAGKWAKFNVAADGTVSNVSSNMSLREQGILFSSAGGRRLGAAPPTQLEKLSTQITALEQRLSSLTSGQTPSPAAPSRSDQIAALTEKVKALELEVKNRTTMLPSSKSQTATTLTALTERLKALLEQLNQIAQSDDTDVGTTSLNSPAAAPPTAAVSGDGKQQSNPTGSEVPVVGKVIDAVLPGAGVVGSLVAKVPGLGFLKGVFG